MRKDIWTNILLILTLFIGLSLLLYPAFSNYWNAQRQTQAINTYADQMAELTRARHDEILESARAYNTGLWDRPNHYILDEEQQAQYDLELNFGDGLMGYMEIPSIGVSLPIYHGTSEKVLKSAVGHLEWSSLPVGGEGSHCLLSGHRGLPSAKLFTDLDQVEIGDTFMLRILDEIFTYEVDQILTVEPHQTEDLLLKEGEDLCTLITCTPYAINTHRLLVRGHRIENSLESRNIRLTSEAIQVEPLLVAPVVAAPILLVLLVLLLIPKRSKPSFGSSEQDPI